MAATLLVILNPTPTAFFLQLALVVVAIALGRSSLVAPQADTVVLVGTTPIASVAASLLADRQERGGVDLLHAATFADAAVLVRSSKVAEVIVADQDMLGASPLVDLRGIHPVVMSGVEAIERLLGRVPLRIDDGGRARTGGASPARVGSTPLPNVRSTLLLHWLSGSGSS